MIRFCIISFKGERIDETQKKIFLSGDADLEPGTSGIGLADRILRMCVNL